MKCAHKQITLYWSGELSAEQMAKVREHLRDCKYCAQYLDELQALASDIQALPELDPGKNLVLNAVRQIAPEAHQPPVRRVAILATVTGLLLVGIAVWTYLPRNTQQLRPSILQADGRWGEDSKEEIRIAAVKNRLQILKRRQHLTFPSRPARFPGIEKEIHGMQHRVSRISTCMTERCPRSFREILIHKRRKG
ncbi:MAG: zf-HC2 domain-containing protein [Desulfobacteraceae bacterium]|nr:MAG: zf-HC2 domain-containing protein [Desulfobacteraceae bacterium]